MGTVEAARGARGSATEFRHLLHEALSDADADDQTGPLLRAAGLQLRLELPDLGLVLNIAPSEEPEHHLRWAFSDQGEWWPKLSLSMDSGVANAYLQGKESLAIGIARGEVRCDCETRFALLYVPAIRLIVERYRKLVRRELPHLLLD